MTRQVSTAPTHDYCRVIRLTGRGKTGPAKRIVRGYPLTLRTTPMRIPQSLPSMSRTLAVTLIAALALPMAGCAGGRSAKGDLPYVARDVGTLYSTAKRRLDQGRYKEAAQLFD
jgi:hypothetical protein